MAVDPRRLCLLAFLAASISHVLSSPSSQAAYFVTNVKSLSVGEDVDYEMRTPSQFSSHLVSSVEAASEAGVPLPRAFLVLVSEQPHANPLAVSITGSGSTGHIVPVPKDDSLAALKKALQLAPSSTVFTSLGASCEGPTVKEALLAEAASKNAAFSDVRLGGECSKDSSEDLESFIQSWGAEAASKQSAEGMSLLLFCLPSTGHSSVAPGKSLLQAYSTLENATDKFAALLIPEAGSAGRATCTRSLIISHPPPAVNGTCGATCRTKATLLEALFVAVVMLIAVVAGLCCMADLDSPTRFETPQDSS